MSGLKQVLELILLKGDSLIILDYQDTYFSVSIDSKLWKYFHLLWMGQPFEFFFFF